MSYSYLSLITVFLVASWNVGPVHIISFSTEVYYFLQYGLEQLVQQYDWLKRDLQVRLCGYEAFCCLE